MFFLLVLGAMLGAAGVILYQQWRSGMFVAEPERHPLPPPSLGRPAGISSGPPVASSHEQRRAA
jgi:hypothetical protein